MIDIVVVDREGNLEKTLFSILQQTMREDISVIVVSNKAHKIIPHFQKKLSIQEIVMKKATLGEMRQKGFDSGSGEYVLFIHSGDVLYDAFSIFNLYRIREDYDAVIGSIFNYSDGRFSSYLVGNLYRRSSIKKHSITFLPSESLENGFHRLLWMSGTSFVFSDDYIYYATSFFSEEKEYELVLKDLLIVLKLAKKRKYDKAQIAMVLYDLLLYFAYWYSNNEIETSLIFKELLGQVIQEYQYYQDFLSEEGRTWVSSMYQNNEMIDSIYLKQLFHCKEK